MADLGLVLGGRYRLEQVLGHGGMATIFRATDGQLEREVAVKVLRPEYGRDAAFVERFRHEAKAAASLSHPNVVAVYDYGTDPAGPYIVMEQVAGGDLSVALGEHGALPPTAVARIGQQVADGLAAAHARGLVHRDIKPGNILLSPDGRVQVADFGIAQAAAGSTVGTDGLAVGSVLYFSPEQARGEAASPPSDIYSLGLVLFELLAGQRPFSGDSPAALAVARLSGPPPSPMAVRPDTPPTLDAIVRWCLAIDPAVRPPATELSAALARYIADPSGAAAFAAAPMAVTPDPSPSAAAPMGVLAPPAASARPAGGGDAERGGSGPLAWMAAGLGLLVIAASAVLLFLLLNGIDVPAPPASPSPSLPEAMVRTPVLVGRGEDEAQRAAERRGLVLEIDYVESASQAGQVIEQLPAPGVRVTAGSAIQVTVGTLVETVVVPDISGIREDDAVALLRSAGLAPGTRSITEDVLPAGYVVTTDPRAGESLTRGSAVTYVVSSGSLASTALAPAATLSASLPTYPAGRQTPFPSAATTLVGDFTCLRLAEARGHITDAGLLVGLLVPGDPPPGNDWLVHGQLPRAGETAAIGSNVDLWLKDPQRPCP